MDIGLVHGYRCLVKLLLGLVGIIPANVLRTSREILREFYRLGISQPGRGRPFHLLRRKELRLRGERLGGQSLL